MSKTHIIPILIILLSAPFLTGSILSINPATEEEELVLIPAAKERSMGRSIEKKVRKHFSIPVDPLVQERIEKIGERLAKGTDRKDIVYRFTVLQDEKDDNYNAFAAPGGYIYIFTDLVEKMETDDAIAGVLAHEMGHVEAKHSVKRMQGAIGATALLLVSSSLKQEKGTRTSANVAIGHLMAAYSRQDEKQADELSVKYLKLAGFKPEGALQSLEKLRVLRKKAPRMQYRIFQSHPYLSERLAHLRKVIKGQTGFESYINLVNDGSEY